MINLASRLLGAGVVATNDELFAAADHLVLDEEASFEARTFGPKGQVYDGWETRRRRPGQGSDPGQSGDPGQSSDPGHDWAIVRLGAPGTVGSVVVDTAHFTGNYPPYASVEACGVSGYPAASELTGWVPLVERSPLAGNTRNEFEVTAPERFTHVRLSIYPDGGVARLRVYGDVVPDPRLLVNGACDLAALEFGGTVVDCSNRFYGSPANLIAPGLARVMGDGWETARRRDDGNDWVLLRLAVPGQLTLAELDTSHFKGNAPGRAALRGLSNEDQWHDLLPETPLQPDTRHRFVLTGAPTVHQVRLDVYPDGGMARLRLYGKVSPVDLADATLRWFNALPASQALAVLVSDGRLEQDAAAVLVARRPLTDAIDLPL
jgi:allantoicase